ncbi:uncharacterized protein BXZ73DRAFT_82973 [Epithele typhae]|uniref:uncharacterized protein n=1 Tax=Epithele typhae TaxID=378194 RepID=UPI0020088D9A|nr:uncharacterized protein BXZ73DRAFT_82973 [Epithele typhae]KAH9911125.1 hypothetical protein BXZ73DRAFT_82973 [Epithele typhae]
MAKTLSKVATIWLIYLDIQWYLLSQRPENLNDRGYHILLCPTHAFCLGPRFHSHSDALDTTYEEWRVETSRSAMSSLVAPWRATTRVLAAVPRSVQYACTNQAVRLSQSYKDAKYGVMAALTEFTKTDACLVWVETMAWMGRGDDVGRALETACEWLSFGSVKLRPKSLRAWVGEHVETSKEYPDAVYEYKLRCLVVKARPRLRARRRGEQVETAEITYQRSGSEYIASVDNGCARRDAMQISVVRYGPPRLLRPYGRSGTSGTSVRARWAEWPVSDADIDGIHFNASESALASEGQVMAIWVRMAGWHGWPLLESGQHMGKAMSECRSQWQIHLDGHLRIPSSLAAWREERCAPDQNVNVHPCEGGDGDRAGSLCAV